MARTQSVTASDDSAHFNVDETHFEKCSEADVRFSISSAGKISQQSDWFKLDEGYQAILPGTGGQTTRTCTKDSNVAKLAENRRVYWLRGAPLSMKFRVAMLVVEATTDSETDFDANTEQLEESQETRRFKHDARQIAHLLCRSRSGQTVD